MESLIVYRGSFDPITNGHLRIGRAASLILNADVAFVPVEKDGHASLKERVKMLSIALKAEGGASFYLDLIEARGKSQGAKQTLEYFKKKNPKVKLYLLLGASQMERFALDPDKKEIAKLATVCYIAREDSVIDDKLIASLKMKRLPYDGAGKVSSQKVRDLLSSDIPLGVRKFIEDNRLYYIDKLAKIINDEHRLNHVISVANLAYEIAVMNKMENPQNAYIAGLLHDLGKSYPKDKSLAIIKENYPEYLSLPSWAYHQFVGAYLAKKEFGITDESIIDAISFHATGKAHMAPLTKVIYSADKIDPSRGYDSSRMIASCKKNYYVGFLYVLRENRKYLKNKGYSLDNPLTAECMDLYLGD